MVKIRYSELPAGLHVTADSDSRGTVIYLLRGLTPAQRRAALARVRSSARMGQGPALPVLSMAAAITADRVRTAAGHCAAAMRGHPVMLVPPVVAVVVSAIVFMLISAVPVTVPPPDKAAASLPALHIQNPTTLTSPPTTDRASPRSRHHGRHGLAGHAGSSARRSSGSFRTPAQTATSNPGTSSPGRSGPPSGSSAPSPGPSSPSPSPTPMPSPTPG
jgi:hypothetical protein